MVDTVGTVRTVGMVDRIYVGVGGWCTFGLALHADLVDRFSSVVWLRCCVFIGRFLTEYLATVIDLQTMAACYHS